MTINAIIKLVSETLKVPEEMMMIPHPVSEVMDARIIAFKLFDFEEYSMDEMSEATKLSKGSCRVALLKFNHYIDRRDHFTRKWNKVIDKYNAKTV